MAVNPQFLAATASVDQSAIAPFPNSEKVYVQGSRSDIRVPFRKITQDDTPSQMGAEKNPPVMVYDTSGPYTDPNSKIDIRNGLPALRAKWIAERGDTTDGLRCVGVERLEVGVQASAGAPGGGGKVGVW